MRLYQRLPTKHLQRIQQDVLNILPDDLFAQTTIIRLTEYDKHLLELPSIHQLLREFEFSQYVLSIQLHVTGPQVTIPIHCDNGFIYSFNIPIANCSNTYVSWYSTSAIPETVRVRDDPAGLTYERFKPTDCALLERVEIDGPYVINTSIPHNVENLTDNTRLMLLCRLHKDIKLAYMEQ